MSIVSLNHFTSVLALRTYNFYEFCRISCYDSIRSDVLCGSKRSSNSTVLSHSRENPVHQLLILCRSLHRIVESEYQLSLFIGKCQLLCSLFAYIYSYFLIHSPLCLVAPLAWYCVWKRSGCGLRMRGLWWCRPIRIFSSHGLCPCISDCAGA